VLLILLILQILLSLLQTVSASGVVTINGAGGRDQTPGELDLSLISGTSAGCDDDEDCYEYSDKLILLCQLASINMPTSQIPVPAATRLRTRPSIPALKFPRSDSVDDVKERGSYFDKYPKRAEQFITSAAPSSNSFRPMTAPTSPRRVRSGTTPKVREKSKDRSANTEPFPSV
jgi:hypothetical protein